MNLPVSGLFVVRWNSFCLFGIGEDVATVWATPQVHRLTLQKRAVNVKLVDLALSIHRESHC